MSYKPQLSDAETLHAPGASRTAARIGQVPDASCRKPRIKFGWLMFLDG